MFETLLEAFQGSPLALWGPLALLLLCGLGLPIPEDIVLIAAGALGEMEGRSWLQVSVVMYLGVIGGDAMIFFAGRQFGTRLMATRWFQRVCSPEKQRKVEQFYEKHGAKGLFIGRFLPGLRAPIFFSAGSLRVSFWKFLALDGFAALISAPFFVWLGHWLWDNFQDNFEELQEMLVRTQSYVLWVTVGIVVVGGALFWLSIRRRTE